MRSTLKFAVVLLALLGLAPASIFAQSLTVVTGTVQDPNGIPYSFGAVTAQLIPVGGTPTLNGAQFATLNQASLDVNGNLSMTLPSNAVILPASTQWQFTVTETGIPFPLGTGPQSFVVSITISGASQSITSTLEAAAPKLTNFAGSGGGGSITACTTPGGVAYQNGTAETLTCGAGLTYNTSLGSNLALGLAAGGSQGNLILNSSVAGGQAALQAAASSATPIENALPGANVSANYQILTGSTGSPNQWSWQSPATLTQYTYVTGAGTANVQTATISPAISGLVAGLQVWWLPVAANTTTTPTLNVNSSGAQTITKNGKAALVANDLTTTAIAYAIYDGTNWELQNPQTVASGSVSGQSLDGIPYNTNGVATALNASTTAPSVNGAYVCGYTVTASAQVPPACPLVGLIADQAAGASVSYSDNNNLIYNPAAALALPTPTTLGNPNFYTTGTTSGGTAPVITPATWTCSLNGATAGSTCTPPGHSKFSVIVDQVASTQWDIDSVDETGYSSGAAIPASAAAVGTNSSKQFIAATPHQIALPLQCADTSSSSTTYTCTTTPSIAALTKGDTFIFTSANQANSGASTLNIDAIGAKTLQKWEGTALAAGDIASGGALVVVYDGTNLQLMTIGNAPSGGGSGTVGSCATTNALAIYTASTTTGCGNADFTYATHTLTMGASGLLTLAAGANNSFILPKVGSGPSVAGAIEFNTGNFDFEGYTGGSIVNFVSLQNESTFSCSTGYGVIGLGSSTSPTCAASSAGGLHNYSSSSLTPGGNAGTYYYLSPSALTMPASYHTAIGSGTTMKWHFAMSKTAAGTGAFNIRFYYGTNGSVSDTTLATQSVGTATAALDDMECNATVTFTSATAGYWSLTCQHSTATATGFGLAIGSQQFSGTLSGLTTTTASLIFGLGYSNTTGTAVITVPLVEAEAYGVN
jgi:hypothetical protein